MFYNKLSQETKDELKEFFDNLPFKMNDRVIDHLYRKNGFIGDIFFNGLGKVTYLVLYNDTAGDWLYGEEISHEKDKYVIQAYDSDNNPREIYAKHL